MEHHCGCSKKNQGPILVSDVCFAVQTEVLQTGGTVCRKKSRFAGEIPCLMITPWPQSTCHFPPSYVQSGLDKAGSSFWAWPTVLFQVRFNSSVILSWKIEFHYVPDHVCTPATLLYEDLP